MPHELSPSLDSLLVHADFLQRLARSLVRDDDAAQDLVQETWLAALRRPPTRGGGRSWLATVVRNLARERGRGAGARTAREEGAARDEELPSVEEITAREDARRDVVEAVLALREPYRATLLHRFYLNLGPGEAAERLGVPVETVRTRTRRGLEEMRAVLDERHGDRSTWCALVAPFANGIGLGGAMQPNAVAPEPASVTTVGTAGSGGLLALPSAWLTVGAVALTALFLIRSLWDDPGASESMVQTAAVGVSDAVDDSDEPVRAAELGAAVPVDERVPVAPAAPTPTGASIRGLVVADEDGAPLSGRSVFFGGLQLDEYDPDGMEDLDVDGAWIWREAQSDARGEFRLDDVDTGIYFIGTLSDGVRAASLGGIFVVGLDLGDDAELFRESLESGLKLTGGRGADIQEIAANGSAEVSLRGLKGGAVRGTVRGRGEPIAGAEVLALPAFSALFAFSGPDDVEAAFQRLAPLTHRLTTDEQGGFELEGLDGAHAVLARAPGFANGEAQFIASDRERAEVLVELAPAMQWDVRGRVLDSSGAPVAGARVYLRPESASRVVLDGLDEEGLLRHFGRPTRTTDRSGGFAFEGLDTLAGSEWIAEEAHERARVIAFVDGRPTGLSPAVAADTAAVVDVVVPAGAPLRGRVVDAETRLGLSASIVVREAGRRLADLESDADGWFDGPPAAYGELQLEVRGAGFDPRSERVTWSPTEELIVAVQRSGWKIRGRVLQPNGEPAVAERKRRFGVMVTHRPTYSIQLRRHDPRPLGRIQGGWHGAAYAEEPAQTALDMPDGAFEMTLRSDWNAESAWLVLISNGREVDAVEVTRGGAEPVLVLDPALSATGTVEIRAVDAETGRRIKEFSADFFRSEDHAYVSHANVQSGASRFGEFSALDVYDVRVTAEGYGARLIEDVALTPDGKVGPLIAELGPGATIRGTVDYTGDMDPRFAANEQVELFDADGRRIYRLAGQTEGFEYAGLGPGSYTLYVRHWKGYAERLEVELHAGETEDLALVLSPTPSVRFEFSQALRDAFHGGFLRVEDEAGRQVSDYHMNVMTGHRDEARIALPPGTYRAELSGPGIDTLESTFTVDGEREVLVRLPQAD